MLQVKKCFKNCRFITTCKAHHWVTHIKQQKLISSHHGPRIQYAVLIISSAHDVMKLIFAVLCVTQWWALHIVIKLQFFTFYICCFSISIHSWDTSTSAFRKQTNAIWKFYIRFWFWTSYGHLHVILQRRNKLCLNWTITERVMTLCRFFKMAAIPSQIFFCFLVLWHLAFRKAKSYLRIKFRPDISIHGQVINTSGVWK